MDHVKALLPLLLLATACSAATPAAASTVRVEVSKFKEREVSSTVADVFVRARDGERNRMRVTASGASLVIADGAGITAGRGCRPRGRRAVTCLFRRFAAVGMNIQLGDGSDTAIFKGRSVLGSEGGLGVKAGPGDDRVAAGRGLVADLRGGSGHDVLRTRGPGSFVGGPGDDRLFGGPSVDDFTAGSTPDGSDTMSGGGGADSVSYRLRTGGVQADLAGDRDDGESGERDRIASDIESLGSGSGNDVLVGNARKNKLVPRAGSDVVTAGAGDDYLAGDEDSPPDDPGDRLIAGAGFDLVFGGPGPDTIDAGPDADTVNGHAGEDRIALRDGAFDDVKCGEGSDAVILDGFDFFVDFPGLLCEDVQRDAPSGAVLQDRSVNTQSGSRTAFGTLGCPGDAPSPCRGTVRLSTSGRTGKPIAFSIARNESEAAKLALDAQTVKRAKRDGRVPATLVVETLQPGAGVTRLVYRTPVSTGR